MESQFHIDLVEVAFNYIKDIVPKDKINLIQIDSSGRSCSTRVVGNYVPDIYYSFDSILIIGEAKTINDFDRPHSKEQFEAYLLECEIYEGKAILIISVPWQLFISAKNYFKRKKIMKEMQFEIIIINELGRCVKI